MVYHQPRILFQGRRQRGSVSKLAPNGAMDRTWRRQDGEKEEKKEGFVNEEEALEEEQEASRERRRPEQKFA